MRSLRPALILALVLAALAVSAPAALGAPGRPGYERAVTEVLVLTRERLGLMDEVMAAKWFSRTPIQDPAQEKVVIEGAVAEGKKLGVSEVATGKLFEAEIAAAKEVELGWGSEWLYLGAPPGLAAPELTTLRAELAEISEKIVAVLPRLRGLARLPNAERRLSREASRVLHVPHLGTAGRLGIVAGLLVFRAAP